MHAVLKGLLTTVPVIVPMIVAMMWYVARRRASSTAIRRSPLPTETEALLFGARLMSDGVYYYSDWSAAMVREFDLPVQPHLEHWYEMAQDLSRQPADQWRSALRLGWSKG